MGNWDTAYERIPAGGSSPSEGDDEIRDFKLEFRYRLNQEHVILNTASTGQSAHRPGSAVCYFQDAEPTLRPDGVTALGSDDTGRLWIDSNDGNRLYVYNNDSSSMEDVYAAATIGEDLVLGAGVNLLTSSTSKISTGGETSPDCINGGITLAHAASTTPVITTKNSSVAHTFTLYAEADTYGQIGSVSINGGGLLIEGYNDNTYMGVHIHGNTINQDTTTASGADGVVTISASDPLVNGRGTCEDNENIFVVKNNESARLILKGDGDLYVYGSYETFDNENDIELSRAVQLHMANKEHDPIYGKRAKELHLIHNGMISVGGVTNLLLGAIFQLNQRLETLEQA